MIDKFGDIYLGMWQKMLDINGVEVILIPKVLGRLQSKEPIRFHMRGVWSGNTAKLIDGTENDGKTLSTVKIKIDDLKTTKFVLDNGDVVYPPTKNLKTFIEKISVDGMDYVIVNEKFNGFHNLIVLEIKRR